MASKLPLRSAEMEADYKPSKMKSAPQQKSVCKTHSTCNCSNKSCAVKITDWIDSNSTATPLKTRKVAEAAVADTLSDPETAGPQDEDNTGRRLRSSSCQQSHSNSCKSPMDSGTWETYKNRRSKSIEAKRTRPASKADKLLLKGRKKETKSTLSNTQQSKTGKCRKPANKHTPKRTNHAEHKTKAKAKSHQKPMCNGSENLNPQVAAESERDTMEMQESDMNQSLCAHSFKTLGNLASRAMASRAARPHPTLSGAPPTSDTTDWISGYCGFMYDFTAKMHAGGIWKAIVNEN